MVSLADEETAGPGGVLSAVLLLHAGIADSRMWKPQVDVLQTAGYRVLAPDLRGFGQQVLEPAPFSYVRDVEALLDGPTAVVGNSLGGRVALELAVLRPDLVERLVVIAPGLPGWEWSDETRAGWAEEEAAFERGDVEAAAEATLRLGSMAPAARQTRSTRPCGRRCVGWFSAPTSCSNTPGTRARKRRPSTPRSAAGSTRSAAQPSCSSVMKTSPTCGRSPPTSHTPSAALDS